MSMSGFWVKIFNFSIYFCVFSFPNHFQLDNKVIFNHFLGVFLYVAIFFLNENLYIIYHSLVIL